MAEIKETYMTKQLQLHGEVRAVEQITRPWTDKKGLPHETTYVELKVDDDDCNRLVLCDTSSDMMVKYKRGMVGTFTLRADLERQFGTGNYNAKILVIKFEEDKGEKA